MGQHHRAGVGRDVGGSVPGLHVHPTAIAARRVHAGVGKGEGHAGLVYHVHPGALLHLLPLVLDNGVVVGGILPLGALHIHGEIAVFIRVDQEGAVVDAVGLIDIQQRIALRSLGPGGEQGAGGGQRRHAVESLHLNGILILRIGRQIGVRIAILFVGLPVFAHLVLKIAGVRRIDLGNQIQTAAHGEVKILIEIELGGLAVVGPGKDIFLAGGAVIVLLEVVGQLGRLRNVPNHIADHRDAGAVVEDIVVGKELPGIVVAVILELQGHVGNSTGEAGAGEVHIGPPFRRVDGALDTAGYFHLGLPDIGLRTAAAAHLEVHSRTHIVALGLLLGNGDGLGNGAIAEADAGRIIVPLSNHIVAAGGTGVGGRVAGGGGESHAGNLGQLVVVALDGLVVVQIQNLIAGGEGVLDGLYGGIVPALTVGDVDVVDIVLRGDGEEGHRILVLAGFEGQLIFRGFGGGFLPLQGEHGCALQHHFATADHPIRVGPGAHLQVEGDKFRVA